MAINDNNAVNPINGGSNEYTGLGNSSTDGGNQSDNTRDPLENSPFGPLKEVVGDQTFK